MALKSLKPHIGIFGRRNVGKSSFINAISEQEVAIVSDLAGTTTDPVKKTIELDQVGPVIIVDTAGIDDIGDVGQLRVNATLKILNQIDLAILIITEFEIFEQELIARFEKQDIPYILVQNKVDLGVKSLSKEVLPFSCKTKVGKERLIEEITKMLPETAYQTPSLMGDLVAPKSLVLMVTPIDSEAPAGRMIMPQMHGLRDCLDNDCLALVVKETELEDSLKMLKEKPALVVTDSQVFAFVNEVVDDAIPLTSFSMLFARMKGDFAAMVEGTQAISHLKEGDSVLILESCSHHSTEDDIGRVKIPRWLDKFTGHKLNYDIVAGLTTPPKTMEEYSLVIQCGGCMLTRQQVLSRIKPAMEKKIPVSNYGMVIAYTHGVFDRVLSPFKVGSCKVE